MDNATFTGMTREESVVWLAESILRDTLRLHPAWSEQRRVRFAIDLATRFYVEIEKED